MANHPPRVAAIFIPVVAIAGIKYCWTLRDRKIERLSHTAGQEAQRCLPVWTAYWTYQSSIAEPNGGDQIKPPCAKADDPKAMAMASWQAWTGHD